MKSKKSKSIHIFFIFIMVVSIVIIAGCTSQNTIRNVSGPNVTKAPISTSIQTIHPLTIGSSMPYIIINPISSHNVGDVFDIEGTTNLSVNAKIEVLIDEPMILDPGPYVTADPNYPYTFSHGYATLQRGNFGTNLWTYRVNLSGFHNPKYYNVNVILIPNKTVYNWTQFFVDGPFAQRF